MFSKVQIANLGLGKLGQSRIENLSPARTALERHVAGGYDQWKRSEIGKRRWVFATEDNVQLGKVQSDVYGDKPFKYELPPDCLRPIRASRSEWKQRGRYVFSGYDNLRISLLMNADETEFDPLFVDVLACRVAVECAEYVTQSNTKKAEAATAYSDAVDEAGKANAFVIGPEYYGQDDDAFPFLTARY